MPQARTTDRCNCPEILSEYENENKQLVKSAEYILFTTFSRDIAEGVTVSPQYLKERIEKANADLWDSTKYFFGNKQGFRFDDETRTLRTFHIPPPKVFTGSALRRDEYSMQPCYQPKSGRHTIAGSLTKNMISEIFWIGLPDRGNVIVETTTDKPIEPCEIGYYRIRVKTATDFWGGGWFYNVFVGKSNSGRTLAHDDCAEIMEMPVSTFTADSHIYGERDGLSNPKQAHPLDKLIQPDEYINRAISEMDGATREETECLKRQTQARKIALEREIETLRNEVAALTNTTNRAANIADKIKSEKRKTAAQKELKQLEQQLFLDGMRIDMEMEEQIKKLADNMKLTAEVKRQFVIRMEGKTA